jgi:hypothetical protein
MGWGNVLQAAVNGYMRGTNFAQDQADSEEERAYRKETREATRADRAEKVAIRTDLKNAARPVSVVEGSGGAVLPETMDNRDVGQPGEAPLQPTGQYRVGAQNFASQTDATAAAAAQNSPEAVAARQAQVYSQRGMPVEAATLEDRQMKLAKHAEELKEKGVFDAARLFRAGDKEGAVAGLRKSKMFNIGEGDVTMTPRDMEIPGIGAIKTYDLTFPMKGEDGKTTPFTINSHTVSMGLLPYEKQIEAMGKATDRASKADDRAERANIAQQRADAYGALAEARATRLATMGSGGGSGGTAKADREYRLVLQNNVANIGREVREADARIKTLQENSIPGRKNPELEAAVAERSQLAQRRDALNDEFLSLAEKKSKGSENIAQAQRVQTKETKFGKLPVVKSKADYDKLKPGDGYIAPDGSEKRKT